MRSILNRRANYGIICAQILIVLSTIKVTTQQEEELPSNVVELSVGKVQGTIMKTQNGAEISAFRGIPYAQPPIGELRFRAPQPALAWTNTLKASRDSLVCPQPGLQALMTEDCLKINIFSRNLTGKAAVMVYIHGGANVLGSGHSLYEAGPQYLLDHDVVMVAFNYRLGALGFLSTQTSEAPGNYGYLDQVLALQWVKEHISKFGGDPDLVTIFGLSAGSMAVTLHMASPLSRGLFHRAIAMSGSATNHFSIDNLYWTRKLAREVSCPMYNPRDVINCLRNVTWNKIVSICSQWEPYGLTNMKWNYEIDNNFLAYHPTDSFAFGNFNKVPLLAGITKNELDFSIYHQQNNAGFLNDISLNFDLYAPEFFLYNSTTDWITPRKSERIKNFYLGNEGSVSKENLDNFGEIFSDGIIGHGMHRLVELARNFIDVYFYRMDYVGQTSLYLNEEKKPRGVGHADDLHYILPGLWYGSQLKPDHPDIFMVERMTGLWVSFAKTGVPRFNGIEWHPRNAASFVTLYNDKEIYMGPEPYKERYALWDEMFPYWRSSAGKLKISIILVVLAYFFKYIL